MELVIYALLAVAILLTVVVILRDVLINSREKAYREGYANGWDDLMERAGIDWRSL